MAQSGCLWSLDEQLCIWEKDFWSALIATLWRLQQTIAIGMLYWEYTALLHHCDPDTWIGSLKMLMDICPVITLFSIIMSYSLHD